MYCNTHFVIKNWTRNISWRELSHKIRSVWKLEVLLYEMTIFETCLKDPSVGLSLYDLDNMIIVDESDLFIISPQEIS